MQVSVYIKNIVPDKMKIKLVIIDAFEKNTDYKAKLKYFYSGSHIDHFLYSPVESTKLIETKFSVLEPVLKA